MTAAAVAGVASQCEALHCLDPLTASKSVVYATHTAPGVYLLVVVYADGRIGLYVGKTSRSMAERFVEHREQFLEGTSQCLVYSGQPKKVFAMPFIQLAGDASIRDTYRSLVQAQPTMMVRQLTNCSARCWR